MIRAVLDANVLVSGIAFRRGVQAAILDHWVARTFVLVLSTMLLKETRSTLDKDFFVERFVAGFEGDVYEALRRAEITNLTTTVTGIATHPEDDLVLSAAVSGKADFLVTGDKQLLKLGAFEGIRIVDSRTFLDILDCQAAEFED